MRIVLGSVAARGSCLGRNNGTIHYNKLTYFMWFWALGAGTHTREKMTVPLLRMLGIRNTHFVESFFIYGLA